MGLLNTAMNAIGTVAAVKSLFGNAPSSTASGRMNSFITEIRQNSVARTNYFEITLTAPKILAGDAATAKKISLYAEGATLPGLFLQTDDGIKRFGIGPQEHVPYSAQVNNTTITFIGDGKGEIYKFFYNWLQGIVRSDYSVPSGNVSRNGLAPYEVEFKEDYRSTLIIRTFNEQGDTIFEYELREAFPKSIADVSLSWSESSLMQFSVEFNYLQSKLLTSDTPVSLSPNGIPGLSPFQKIAKIGTAVQAIASLKRPQNVQDAISSITTIKNLF